MRREELAETVKQDLETRVREGIKALFEQSLFLLRLINSFFQGIQK